METDPVDPPAGDDIPSESCWSEPVLKPVDMGFVVWVSFS